MRQVKNLCEKIRMKILTNLGEITKQNIQDYD